MKQSKLNANKINLMIDLETTGTRPGCCILQVAAVPFAAEKTLPNFNRYISYVSCKEAGLHNDPDTISWWDKQSPHLRATVFSGTADLREVLEEFSLYCTSLNGVIIPWSYGANFDIEILTHTFGLLGIPVPWHYRNIRCARTLVEEVKLPYAYAIPEILRFGPKHDALSDAQFQAQHIYRRLKFLQELDYAYSDV